MDEHGNAQPVAFCLTEKDDAETLSGMLADFSAAVRDLRPDWLPSCFLVDDDAAEHNAIRRAPSSLWYCRPACRVGSPALVTNCMGHEGAQSYASL